MSENSSGLGFPEQNYISDMTYDSILVQNNIEPMHALCSFVILLFFKLHHFP